MEGHVREHCYLSISLGLEIDGCDHSYRTTTDPKGRCKRSCVQPHQNGPEAKHALFYLVDLTKHYITYNIFLGK